MDDTILTPRQKHIVNLINQSEGLLREEIHKEIVSLYPVSKITLIRDLNILLKNKFIKSQGRARATKYLSKIENPLLRQFNLESYFINDSDSRKNVKKTFDFKIVNYLSGLFSQQEIEELKKISHSFKKETDKLNQDILKRELERFVIELSWKSSKIEGNTYSLLETETLIKEQKTAVGKSKEEAVMILNHKIVFEEILKNKNDFKILSISKVNQLLNLLIKDLNVTTGIRRQAVGITGTTYQPLDNEHQLKEVFEKTIQVINDTINVFDKSFIAHFMIPYIQPYSNGNKRTARMLTNAIFLAYDLFPLSYRSINEDNFKKALILFYEQGSVFEIKKIFIEQLKFANKTYFR